MCEELYYLERHLARPSPLLRMAVASHALYLPISRPWDQPRDSIRSLISGANQFIMYVIIHICRTNPAPRMTPTSERST